MDILALKTLVREVGSAIGQSDDLGEKAASMMHLAVVFEVEGLVALRDWEPLLAAIEVRPCLQPHAHRPDELHQLGLPRLSLPPDAPPVDILAPVV